jgi:glycine cleavage system regulatory protein
LNRNEAVDVFKDVVESCKRFLDLNFVSITDSKAENRKKSTGYEIYIKCNPNNNLKQCLTPILDKRQLKMAELENAIIVYKPKSI